MRIGKFLQRAAVLALATSLLLAGCQNEAPVPASSEEEGLLVGFSMATLKEDRWLRDRDIFSAKAKQEGINVLISNANNDAERQYEQVVDMVEQGVDVLVIAPHDCDNSARCVTLAKRAGIPVISYDRLVKNANVDVYISFDNYKVGELQGKAILEAVPEGGYILLNGSEDDSNSQMYYQGCMDQLQPAIDAGKIQVEAETWVQDWRRETAFSFTSDVLREKGDKIDAVVAANDSLAWAAIDALSEARLMDQVKVVGHDADLAACQRIVSGTQLMTVYKPIPDLVDKTIEACKILAQGNKIESEKTIDDGTYQVPYWMIDVIAVTKENMDDTVIKDGFHLKEDVYRQETYEMRETGAGFCTQRLSFFVAINYRRDIK